MPASPIHRKASPKSPYQDYPSTQRVEWTRIDMLLALYSGAMEQLQATIDATAQHNSVDALTHRMRAAALVVAIRSGIDTRLDELPLKIDQLCEFVQHCLANGDEPSLASALRVLTELHAGFAGIRTESLRLEKEGTIPPLNTAPQLDATC